MLIAILVLVVNLESLLGLYGSLQDYSGIKLIPDYLPEANFNGFRLPRVKETMNVLMNTLCIFFESAL